MCSIVAIAAGRSSIVALSSAASAADLPPKIDYTKAPPLVAPVHNWAGLYIGLNGGGGDRAVIAGISPVLSPVPPEVRYGKLATMRRALWSAVRSDIVGR